MRRGYSSEEPDAGKLQVRICGGGGGRPPPLPDRLVPAPDGGDDFVWIGGPGEGLRFLIVLFEEAVDRGLQVGDRSKDAAL